MPGIDISTPEGAAEYQAYLDANNLHDPEFKRPKPLKKPKGPLPTQPGTKRLTHQDFTRLPSHALWAQAPRGAQIARGGGNNGGVASYARNGNGGVSNSGPSSASASGSSSPSAPSGPSSTGSGSAGGK